MKTRDDSSAAAPRQPATNDASPQQQALQQAGLGETGVDHSPRQLAQRRLLSTSFGPVAQTMREGQPAQLHTVDSSAFPVQRTVWEWVGKYWNAVRTEGDITPQPGHPGAYVGERISTGDEDPWGEAP